MSKGRNFNLETNLTKVMVLAQVLLLQTRTEESLNDVCPQFNCGKTTCSNSMNLMCSECLEAKIMSGLLHLLSNSLEFHKLYQQIAPVIYDRYRVNWWHLRPNVQLLLHQFCHCMGDIMTIIAVAVSRKMTGDPLYGISRASSNIFFFPLL